MPDDAPVMTATRPEFEEVMPALCPRDRPYEGPCERGSGKAPQMPCGRSTVLLTALGRPGAEPHRTMDPSRDISEFLASRRAKISPEGAGLPSFGSRRVPGLRREEVASLAGVSADYYR